MSNLKTLRFILPIAILSMVSLACAFSFDLGGAAKTPVPQNTPVPTATLQASAEPTSTAPVQPTDNAAQASGSIRGKLSYPSELIPPLRVVAFHLENGAWNQYYTYVDTNPNASEYQIDGLQPGLYWITAYTISNGGGAPAGLAGGYSQAVLCGLTVDCTDHSLVAVEVKSGQVTGGADPGDWYAPEGSFLASPAP